MFKKLKLSKRAGIFAGMAALFAVLTLTIPDLNRPFQNLNRDLNVLYSVHSGHSAYLDPSIKILAYDDKSTTVFNRPDLSIKEWNFLVQKLTSAGARRIIIDKKFGFFSDDEKEKLQSFAMNVKISGRVAAGVALHSGKLPLYEPISANERPAFDISRFDQSPEVMAQIPLLDKHAYGAPVILRSAFAYLGFLNIEPDLRVKPIARLAGGIFMPYIGLTEADSLRVNASGLYVNDHYVPRRGDGTTSFRIIDPKYLFERQMSIGGLFSALAKGVDIGRVINKGDTVLILPTMYTGNVDFERTAVGHLPRGFLLASFIHSVKTGEWETFSIAAEVIGALILAFVLLICAGKLTSVKYYSMVIGISLGTIMGCVVLYDLTLFNYNWSAVLLFPIIFSLFEHVLVNRKKDVENLNLRMSLRNALPEQTVNDLLNSPEKLLADPKEAILTIVFIDIACFSLYTERTNPTAALKYLTEVLEKMTEIVHEHGGFVDKSLGDGMLCVFGHQFSPDQKTENQADQAISCAIALQKMNVDNIANSNGDFAPLPLRIGINTGKVFVGNLGGKRRTDFTVIGKSVNFAQRLEAACEQHRILLSHSTYELSHIEAEHGLPVQKRLIQIKHHADLIEAVEVNPFRVDEDKMIYKANQSFRSFFAMERKDDRWPAELVAKMVARTEFGSSVVVDFSNSGACLLLDRYLAAGVRVSFEIDSEDGALSKTLAKHGLSRLDAVVKWGRKKEGQFLHGVYFDRLNDQQKNILRTTVEGIVGSLPLTI